MNFEVIKALVFAAVPEVQIPINPATMLITLGLGGLIWTELRAWRRER